MHIFLDKMSLIAADTPSISPPLPPFPLTLPPDFLLLFVEKKNARKKSVLEIMTINTQRICLALVVVVVVMVGNNDDDDNGG